MTLDRETHADTALVPFGKYKNQPLSQLTMDLSYCEWLLAQSWLAERYPNLHTLIIHQGNQPVETPEHNAMQLRFLDSEYCQRICMTAVLPRLRQKIPLERRTSTAWSAECLLSSTDPATFEVQGMDVGFTMHYWIVIERETFSENYFLCCGRAWRVNQANVPKNCPSCAEPFTWNCAKKACGIVRSYQWKRSVVRVVIECKTSLGDDYPAVLRQMQASPAFNYQSPSRVLLYQQFSARGGSEAQVRQFFASAGVDAVSVADVETRAQPDPVSEQYLPQLPPPLFIKDERTTP